MNTLYGSRVFLQGKLRPFFSYHSTKRWANLFLRTTKKPRYVLCNSFGKKGRYSIPHLNSLLYEGSEENIIIWERLQPSTFSNGEPPGLLRVREEPLRADAPCWDRGGGAIPRKPNSLLEGVIYR